MITASAIRSAVEPKVTADGHFLVEVTVSPTNDIVVVVDDVAGLPLSYCEELSAYIEGRFDREREDYSLEVGTAGIGCELRVTGQFVKNLNHQVEVTLPNGSWVRGTLTAADDEGFDLEREEKRKVEGEKKKQTVVVKEHYLRADVKSVKDII